MKIKLVQSFVSNFERELNIELDKLRKQDSVILDIKIVSDPSGSTPRMISTIIYCEKDEIRNSKIDNLLLEP